MVQRENDSPKPPSDHARARTHTHNKLKQQESRKKLMISSYLTKINDNLEESIHQQNSVGENAAAVQEHRLWKRTGGIGPPSLHNSHSSPTRTSAQKARKLFTHGSGTGLPFFSHCYIPLPKLITLNLSFVEDTGC